MAGRITATYVCSIVFEDGGREVELDVWRDPLSRRFFAVQSDGDKDMVITSPFNSFYELDLPASEKEADEEEVDALFDNVEPPEVGTVSMVEPPSWLEKLFAEEENVASVRKSPVGMGVCGCGRSGGFLGGGKKRHV